MYIHSTNEVGVTILESRLYPFKFGVKIVLVVQGQKLEAIAPLSTKNVNQWRLMNN